jgi:hypothetical protein
MSTHRHAHPPLVIESPSDGLGAIAESHWLSIRAEDAPGKSKGLMLPIKDSSGSNLME